MKQSMMEKSDKLVEKAQKIKCFFTDVDGTLTDGWVYYSAEGEQLKAFSLRDGTGFFLLRQVGIRTGIITTENSPIVAKRAEKLKVDAYIFGSEHKLEMLSQFVQANGLTFDEIAYIGDEINDYKLIDACGLSFAVADAVELVKRKADIVLSNKGGQHAFREAVEMLFNLKGLDIKDIIESSL